MFLPFNSGDAVDVGGQRFSLGDEGHLSTIYHALEYLPTLFGQGFLHTLWSLVELTDGVFLDS